MHRKWFVNRTNPEYVEYLSKAASISPVLAQILINKGVRTPEDVHDFLNPRISNLSDPFELSGVQIAVERIKKAVERNERVLVHGDYDADGLSATAIMFHTLKGLGLDVHYFVPNRVTQGYGFNPAGVEKAKELGARLIVTVDCGITSFEAVSLSKKEGIDVIITDHHEPLISQQSLSGGRNSLLPDALAIINPRISSPSSSVSNLSGAGVAFKFAQALDKSASGGHDPRFTIHEFIDLAAIGTIADVVPITGENRILVREGLREIADGKRPGIRALKEISGINKRGMKSGLLSFTIIPRINAAGRISDANNVVRLLLTDSEDEAMDLSSWLDRVNSERQQIDEEVYKEACSKLHDKGIRSAIVLSSERWHPGVIGIVASRIAEAFYRPTLVISIEGPTAKGSARSIPPFDIYRGLTGCRELLTGYGGHKLAAGFALKSEDIPYFEERIAEIVSEDLSEEDFTPSLEIDADVNLSHVTFSLIKELETLEPLGLGNPEPLLGSKGLEVLSPRVVGNNHLKMKLRQRSYCIDAIGFDMALFFDRLEVSTTIDAVYTPLINEWERGRCLQLNLKAFRPGM